MKKSQLQAALQQHSQQLAQLQQLQQLNQQLQQQVIQQRQLKQQVITLHLFSLMVPVLNYAIPGPGLSNQNDGKYLKYQLMGLFSNLNSLLF